MKAMRCVYATQREDVTILHRSAFLPSTRLFGGNDARMRIHFATHCHDIFPHVC